MLRFYSARTPRTRLHTTGHSNLRFEVLKITQNGCPVSLISFGTSLLPQIIWVPQRTFQIPQTQNRKAFPLVQKYGGLSPIIKVFPKKEQCKLSGSGTGIGRSNQSFSILSGALLSKSILHLGSAWKAHTAGRVQFGSASQQIASPGCGRSLV